MNGTVLLDHLHTADVQMLFESLYGSDYSAAIKRYGALIKALLRESPEADVRLFSAPGRTELGGNHTDHNRGKVLAASVHLDNVAAASQSGDTIVCFRSTGYPDVRVDLKDTSPVAAEKGSTEALIRGIAAEFSARNLPVGGWNAVADSLVPGGSGLSSSASVEMLIGRIFDSLYGSGGRSFLELAQIGQKAENDYFGKPSGLMDQTACASGGVVAIDFEDPAAPRVKRLNFNPAASGLTLCVVDTRTSHADLTGEYAAIPGEMKAVAQFFGKAVLRDMNPDDLFSNLPALRGAVGDRALLRALHFFNENERVNAMQTALQNTMIEDFLELVRESGDSSWELLQNCSVAGETRNQGIGVALAMTKNFLGKSGACRVHGGGFAGTIQSYVPTDRLAAYRNCMEGIFGAGAVTELKIRALGAEEILF
ncbi:galactokinase [Spirochaetia bacterium]|nr:galactokinase [Spirochaetia bacterium]